MASKSKRRRRVLGASCILAALIVAGSSFAWFTSKDEVTNRLTASADYNVAIIENFVPPKQFVPGQTVTKEEAVVNTGSVDAFVKQTLSGNLAYTVEVPSQTNPKDSSLSSEEKAKYITLDKADYGLLEAGSTLAWAPAASTIKPGYVIGMGIDGATDENHGFAPTAEGLYVFRRAVYKDADDKADVNYDYVGYYYDGTDTFYKLYSLSVAPKSIVTAKNDDTFMDSKYYGTLTAEPKYSFAIEEEVVDNNVPMFYVDGSEPGKKRLKIQFNGKNIVDQAAAGGTVGTANSGIYNAYRDYLNKYKGQTTYVAADPTWPTAWTGTGYTSYAEYLAADADDRAAKLGAGDQNKIDKYEWDKYYRAYTPWQTDKPADTNNTGLTTYQEYDIDGLNNTATDADKAASDLSNLGYERLKDLKDGTADALAEKSPGTGTEADWNAAQKLARDSRQTVNNGEKASTYLAAYKTDVLDQIGAAGSGANASSTDPGLYLQTITSNDTTKADTFKWSAKFLGDTTTYPTTNTTGDAQVNFDLIESNGDTGMLFKNFSSEVEAQFGLSADDLLDKTMTLDTMNEKQFQDPGTNTTATAWPTGDASVKGSSVKWQNVNAPYAASAKNSDLGKAWDNLVYNTQRLKLNQKKQAMITEVMNSTDPNVKGKFAQTAVYQLGNEGRVFLDLLKEEERNIKLDIKTAKDNYDTEVKKVKDAIDEMNTCQAVVDLANKEYDGYYGTSPYTKPAADDATLVNPSAAIVGSVDEDTPEEDTFEDYLKAAFGDAKKDSAVQDDYKVTFTNTKTGGTDPATYTDDNVTYSWSVTKKAIDDDLKKENGVTSWDTNATIYTTTSSQSPIEAAPYWKDVVAGNMLGYRETETDGLYDTYANLAAAQGLFRDYDDVGDVTIYVNLTNIGTDTNAKWQYIGEASETQTATEFDFGYTGILESGKRSALLIESVEFDPNVKQESFRNLQLDINAALESAQVVYYGDRVQATAARSSITDMIPTQEEYENSSAVVNWEANTTNVLPTTTANDPRPKDTSVAPETP